MLQQTEFQIENAGQVAKFTKDKITITTNEYTIINGMHYITRPETAVAHFLCFGNIYVVRNTSQYVTVESWYQQEIFPKFKMLLLLETPLLA